MLYGMNVISFAVWGEGTSYTYGVLENCIQIKNQMPTFQSWVYYNNSLPKEVKECLEKLGNVRLIKMPDRNDKKNTMWRFLPAFDPKVNILLVRDADSRIEFKEIVAIIEWLQSDKDFHIMRDHPMHKRKVLAGMWGCRKQILVQFRKMYEDYLRKPFTLGNWIVDELFLQNYIYPHIANRAFVHAKWNKYERHAKDFPDAPRNKFGGFIGCPSGSTYWIRKEFPQLKVPRLFKKRNG
jgi:hypothetical protein